MTILTSLADALFHGDGARLRSLMAHAQIVDDQRLGRRAGLSDIESWTQEVMAWASGLQAKPSVVATLGSETRAVVELSLDIKVDEGVVDLPFVLVADLDGGAISVLRTYHSTWPYTGSHALRQPPLEGESRDPIPVILTRYIAQVSNADVGAVLATFTEDGYVREPSGNRWKHLGAEERAKFYGHLATAPRPSFVLNACVEDGPLIAVEYSFAYGDVPMVGGVCIMEHAGDRIVAVRIADDVGA